MFTMCKSWSISLSFRSHNWLGGYFVPRPFPFSFFFCWCCFSLLATANAVMLNQSKLKSIPRVVWCFYARAFARGTENSAVFLLLIGVMPMFSTHVMTFGNESFELQSSSFFSMFSITNIANTYFIIIIIIIISAEVLSNVQAESDYKPSTDNWLRLLFNPQLAIWGFFLIKVCMRS